MKHKLHHILGLILLPGFCPAQQVKPVIPVPQPPPTSTPMVPPNATAPANISSPEGGMTVPPSASIAPSSTSVGPPPPANAPQVSSSYIIGPEDGVTVNVWKEPQVSGAFAVRPDGMISLPLVGDVLASGLTPMALGSDLAVRLKKYLTDPLVTVTVTAVNSKHYYMVGEVVHTGVLPLTPGMTPLQAIAAAGGLSAYANSKHIYILRTENGKQLKIPYNYKRALKDGNQQGVTLASGDTIVVP